jgi:hypothetical protein
MTAFTLSDRDLFEILGLRSAIGIVSTEFELAEEDYFELYQFDPPIDYDAFRRSCDQVKAKWPSRALFARLEARYFDDVGTA